MRAWIGFVGAAALTAGMAMGCGDSGTKAGDATTADATGDTRGDSADATVVDTHVDAADGSDAPDGDDAPDPADTSVIPDTDHIDVPDVPPDTAPEDTGPADADATPPTATVVLNEVDPSGDPADWVELYNAGLAAQDLSGWVLRDSDLTDSYVFPDGTTLAAHAFLAVERGDAGFGFGLGAEDSALLYQADGTTLVDGTAWLDGDAPAGGSWGRYPDGTGDFSTRYVASEGAANPENAVIACGDGTLSPATEVCDGADFGTLDCARWGWGGGTLTCADSCTRIDQGACTDRAPGLVINEVTSSGDDRIELYNGSAVTIVLADYKVLDDAANELDLPAGTTIAAGAYLVLVKGTDHTFGLGGDDAVILQDPDGVVVDTADWEDGEALVSYCRFPDGVGGFRPCPSASFGGANIGE